MAARLTQEQKRYVVKHLTLGTSYRTMQVSFQEKFDRTINRVTIAKYRRDNAATINGGRELMVQEAASSGAKLKQKAYGIMDRRLDRVIEDESELQKLRQQLRSGEITESTYKFKVSLYEKMTTNELINITEAMTKQSKGNEDDPVTPQDQAALTALVAGIQSGNPVQLIQIMSGRAGNPEA